MVMCTCDWQVLLLWYPLTVRASEARQCPWAEGPVALPARVLSWVTEGLVLCPNSLFCKGC